MIKLIFEHTDFIVASKPAGMNFHCEDGQAGFIAQLTEQLHTQQPLSQSSTTKVDSIFAVHRLDKMTSGLLVVALNKKAAQEFEVMFRERKVSKFYLAISNQKPKKKQGWVKGGMSSARNGSWKLCKTQQNPAVTQFISVSLQPQERLFLLKPLTGKTHQLRVMMKSLSAPICGDERYAAKEQAKQEERGYLHAYALRFSWHGKEFSFIEAPTSGARFLSLPCQHQLKEWQNPWQLIN